MYRTLWYKCTNTQPEDRIILYSLVNERWLSLVPECYYKMLQSDEKGCTPKTHTRIYTQMPNKTFFLKLSFLTEMSEHIMYTKTNSLNLLKKMHQRSFRQYSIDSNKLVDMLGICVLVHK